MNRVARCARSPARAARAGASLSLVLAFAAAAGEPCTSLGQRFRDSGGGEFVAPRADEVKAAGALFREVLDLSQAAPAATPQFLRLKQDWAALGFELATACASKRGYLTVQELATRREGRGFYAFATGRSGEHALTAPHRFSDVKTGEIALDWMRAGPLRAAAWSTVGRYQGARAGGESSDLAHRADTHFVAFTVAYAQWAAERPGAHLVLQLHGFDAAKYDAAEMPGGTRLIVSAGTRSAPPAVRDYARQLAARIEGVRRYPEEIQVLGGTTNAVGRALRDLKCANVSFVHLEAGVELRSLLGADPAAGRAFVESLP